MTRGQAPAGNRPVKPHTVGDGLQAATDSRSEEVVQIAAKHLPTPYRPGVDVEEEGARVPAHATALQVKGLAMRVGQARRKARRFKGIKDMVRTVSFNAQVGCQPNWP